MIQTVEVSSLRKTYPGTIALDGISFAVPAGQIVGLLGPNGAGKTTLLHCLMGLLEPTSGTLKLLGEPTPQGRWKILPRINFAAADADLPSNLTVRETLDLYARLYSVPRRRQTLDEIMQSVNIAEFSRRLMGQLSAGEKMRVKLAKALINRPELLLLDEPTLNLDPATAESMRQWLSQMHRQRPFTILWTSHNMPEVERYCQRVLFLHRGRLLADGAPAEVLKRFGQPNLEALFLQVAASGELIDVESKA